AVATLARTAEAVPTIIGQQGRVYDVDTDEPIEGDLTITFALYDTKDAPIQSPVWTEQHDLTLDKGYFSVALGSVTDLDTSFFDGASMYLSMTIAGDEQMTPRLEVGSVPYALVCNDATGDIHPTSVTVEGPEARLVVDGAIEGQSLTISGAVSGTAFSAWDTDASDDVLTSTALQGDVTGTSGATVVGDDTHNHTGMTILALSPMNFTLATVSQWTNDAGYTIATNTLTGLVRSTEPGNSYFMGGNFGIGTASPNAKLELKHNDDWISLENNAGAEILRIQQQAAGTIADIIGAGNRDLYINYNSTGNVAIAAGGGNVGIGLTNPGAKLTVRKDATDPGAYDDGKALFVTNLMGSGQSYDGGVEFRHDNLSQGIGFGYNTIYQTGFNANQQLNLIARGSGPITLNAVGGATGNVGIGTAAPAQKLHVVGTVRATAFEKSDGTPVGGGGSGMSFSPCPSDSGTFLVNFGGWGNFLATAGGAHILVSDPDITIVSNRVKVAKAGKYVIAGNVFCNSGGASNDYTHVGVQQVNTAGSLVGPRRLFSHGSPNANNDTYSEKSGTAMFLLAAGEGIQVIAYNHNTPTCWCNQYYNSWSVWKL
ncbi:hypothetical protein JYT28_01685, partial [Desulfobulbus sp. AH-315-M07]|nr:hypothetical protein [Desulfobulbus sp. AH-315-M07]